MRKNLIKNERNLYHFENTEKINGANKNMRSDCSGLYGDCTGLTGNCTGLSGDCTGWIGDLDICDLSDTERKKGVNIEDLIKE